MRDVILYTGYIFWNAPPFTGMLKEMFPKHHRRIHLMNAWYFSMAEIAHAQRYYGTHLGRSQWWHSFAGRVPRTLPVR